MSSLVLGIGIGVVLMLFMWFVVAPRWPRRPDGRPVDPLAAFQWPDAAWKKPTEKPRTEDRPKGSP